MIFTDHAVMVVRLDNIGFFARNSNILTFHCWCWGLRVFLINCMKKEEDPPVEVVRFDISNDDCVDK